MLSQASGYAIQALGCIANSETFPVLIKGIAEVAGIPAPYLAKIIHALSRRGLVITQRGVGGGVTLSREPKDITLFDVCEALDDPVTKTTCMLGTAECSDDRACPSHFFWRTHRTAMLEFLGRTTVADIAAFEQRRRATANNAPKVAPDG